MKPQNPQDAFLDLLIAAMNDAAIEGKLTQLQVQIMPPGKTTLERVRIIVVPEVLKWSWPMWAPAGTPES